MTAAGGGEDGGRTDLIPGDVAGRRGKRRRRVAALEARAAVSR